AENGASMWEQVCNLLGLGRLQTCRHNAAWTSYKLVPTAQSLSWRGFPPDVHVLNEGISPVPSAGGPAMLQHVDSLVSSRTLQNPAVPLLHLRDLETARQVQRNLFPRQLPCLPGWDLAAVCRPARIVAGDYHDLFTPVPGCLAIALGDVAGKGLGPALVMAHLHTLIRSRLPAHLADLAGLVNELNAHLLAVLPEEMFVTLFLAVVELDTGRMRYV